MNTIRYCLAAALLTFLSPGGRAEITMLLRQGDQYDAERRTAEALAVYRQAEQIDPNRADLLHRISKQLGESIQDTASREERRALAAQALAYARRAVAADPRDSNAHVSMAICLGLMTPYQSNKEKVAASREIESYARRALQLDPGNELAHYVLGVWNQGIASLNPVLSGIARVVYGRLPPASHQAAAQHFQQAVAVNPDRAATWVGLGSALAELGRTTEARSAFDRALSLPVRYKDDEATKARAREAIKTLENE
jgi:tetratricopeptide (TPR) repeat protein